MLVYCFLPIPDSRFFLVVTCFITVCQNDDADIVDIPLKTAITLAIACIWLSCYYHYSFCIWKRTYMLVQVHIIKTKLKLLESCGVFQGSRRLGYNDPRSVFRNPSNTVFLWNFFLCDDTSSVPTIPSGTESYRVFLLLQVDYTE